MIEYFPLSKQQEKAATAPEPRVLCVAGAGSGKTRVLVGRVCHIFGEGIDPQRILCITFTRKAANEMRERIGEQLGEQIAKLTWIDTFHSICLRMIREFGYTIGYKDYTIFDAIDRRDISNHLNTTFKFGLSRKDLDSAFKFYDGHGRIPGGIGGKLIHLYLTKMRSWKAIDFGMIINECHRMLMAKNNVLEHYRKKFQFILVDEYQDTDPLQQQIIDLLQPGNLFCVGDDFQSVYGWRNSDISLILNYPEKHKNHGVGVYKLERNYRSTMQIVAGANRVIANNEKQMLKNCYSEKQGPPISINEFADQDAESIFIIEKIKHMIRTGMPLKDIAILYRKHNMTVNLVPHLDAAKIPYHVVSPEKAFWESKEIRGIQSVLYALLNGNGHHLRQAVMFPTTRTNYGRWASFCQWAAKAGMDEWTWLNRNLDQMFGSDELISWLTAANFIKAGIGYNSVDWVIEQTYMMLGITDYYQEKGMTSRLERLQYFKELSIIWEKNTYGEARELRSFLDWIRLRDMQITLEEEKDAITLLTVHSAKGLEWKAVFLLGLEEGNWPIKRQDSDISEERRLFYVGITRAETDLFISYIPGRIFFKNKKSRFLRELEGDTE